MGMAASQARYLALTARKSNIEYEGQQINQSRTALANQSANLFNQMLDMEVPTPPSTSDFTTIQYSFSDGVNTEVLSNYYQLGTPDEDYNYVVTTYHTEKVYTGSSKKLNDPQVQATTTHNYSYDPESADNNKQKTVTKASYDVTDGSYLIQTTDGATSVFRPVKETEEDQVKAINYANGVYQKDTVDFTQSGATDGYAVCTADDLDDIKRLYKDDTITDATKYYKKAGSDDIADKYTLASNITPTAKANSEVISDEGKGLETTGDQTYYTDGTQFITKADLDNAVLNSGSSNPNSVNIITMSDSPEFSNYTAVGNCALTQLTEADMKDEAIKAEINQIIKDMKAEGGDTKAAENLLACFDSEGNYKGGIYKFQMNGVTYFTTNTDLDTSLGSSIVGNSVDVQQEKLRYYNATYLDKKIEETQKAMLETDGNGRFSSVKLENDSVKYTLNTETVTDENAYNDAMNRYYYEDAQYEKAISDINAQTEIIQAQDRTLELRLEQLNTEQSALQNEMEAVKKVVDKHVEQGFKTFGG